MGTIQNCVARLSIQKDDILTENSTKPMIDTDYFLFSGGIERRHVLPFMEQVAQNKTNDKVCLFLVTGGGDPDAAYKMARYLQDSYDHFTLCLGGFCKSAGTLIATAATELAFAPYGELGPLDIQLSKRDDIMGLESGLNISEAFVSLSSNVRNTYNHLIMDILRSSGGVISFQTASHSAAEIISGIYGPVYAQIEPDEVGSRARAMRIGQEYATRLNERFENMQVHGVDALCQMYPSHGFVIDIVEAKLLFENVRTINEIERTLLQNMGMVARHPSESLAMTYLNDLLDLAADDSAEENGVQPNGQSAEGTAEPAPTAARDHPVADAKQPSGEEERDPSSDD